jgi:hypothetical protein
MDMSESEETNLKKRHMLSIMNWCNGINVNGV